MDKINCFKAYDIRGKVNDESTYGSFLQFAAQCYHVMEPIPTTPSRGIIGGSLMGITMFLLALGSMIKRG